MASYSRRERITKHVEYTVPIGDTLAELGKAAAVAGAELAEAFPGRIPGDDALRIDSDGEHIIIRFEVPAGGDLS